MILIIKGSRSTIVCLKQVRVSITDNLLPMMIQRYLRKLSQKKINDLVCWFQNENKNEMSPCATSLSHQRPSFPSWGRKGETKVETLGGVTFHRMKKGHRE